MRRLGAVHLAVAAAFGDKAGNTYQQRMATQKRQLEAIIFDL